MAWRVALSLVTLVLAASAVAVAASGDGASKPWRDMLNGSSDEAKTKDVVERQVPLLVGIAILIVVGAVILVKTYEKLTAFVVFTLKVWFAVLLFEVVKTPFQFITVDVRRFVVDAILYVLSSVGGASATAAAAS